MFIFMFIFFPGINSADRIFSIKWHMAIRPCPESDRDAIFAYSRRSLPSTKPCTLVHVSTPFTFFFYPIFETGKGGNALPFFRVYARCNSVHPSMLCWGRSMARAKGAFHCCLTLWSCGARNLIKPDQTRTRFNVLPGCESPGNCSGRCLDWRRIVHMHFDAFYWR